MSVTNTSAHRLLIMIIIIIIIIIHHCDDFPFTVHHVSFTHNDDDDDVMKITMVIISCSPCFSMRLIKNEHVLPHFLLLLLLFLLSESSHFGLNPSPFTFSLVSVDSSLFSPPPPHHHHHHHFCTLGPPEDEPPAWSQPPLHCNPTPNPILVYSWCTSLIVRWKQK